MRSDRHAAQKKRGKIIAVTAVIIIAAAAACIAFAMHHFSESGTKKAEKPAVKKVVYRNPLTGEEVKKGSLPARPIIVSTDNDSSLARPQSGLSKADIVYEVPAEGGASRYEPIYYSSFPKQAGPTRSVRPYIVDIAREYGAVLVHNGYSPQAKAYLEENVVPYYPAQKYDDLLFWRTSDRYAPHNQYTNVKKDYKKIKEDGNADKQEIRTFKWLSKKSSAEGKDAKEVKVNYQVTANTYKYDAESGLYKRYVEGSPCTDAAYDNKQITCANIIIQKVSSSMYDEKRLNIDMTEGGTAWLFTGGKAVKGTWERSGLDSETVFKDSDGKEFRMTRGKTWIQLINSQCTIDYE